MSHKSQVIIIGMARSGTTLISNILGGLDQVKIAIEPHALWKTGNYSFLNDEEYEIKEDSLRFIRKRLESDIGDRTLIEKSPINCIRPKLVHAAFPDAKIVYVERDPVRCIYSNYIRTLKNDSFKPSIVLKKYFGRSGSEDLPFARSHISLIDQLQPADFLPFIKYMSYMLYQRNVGMKQFPFGTKIKNFKSIIESEGAIAYHVAVYKQALKCKEEFKNLFENIYWVQMEDVMNNKKSMSDLINFTGLSCSSNQMQLLYNQIDRERKQQAEKKSSLDQEILRLL